MRIDNSYLSGLAAGEIRQNAEAADAAPKGEAKVDSSYPLHVPSPELDQLRQLLQASPDVRPDVMARVSLLLQSGYYSSPEAAEKTADSMIRAIE
ncbi:MAG TPA: hypothetical protein VE988_19625 [Gemmataceae bacterium]|nr:hypothetical protein [Gemmataceae bacterium]